jgi:dynein heavy chain, axonemal
LAKFVINIVDYNKIYKKVKPLMDFADAAEKLANEMIDKLKIGQEKVSIIVEKVDGLKRQLYAAIAKKEAVEDDANRLILNL